MQDASPLVFIGIDVSKNTWDIHVSENGQTWTSPTSDEALKKLVKKLEPYLGRSRIVMEATGGFERNLMIGLIDAGHVVSVVNPRRVRDFAKANGQFGKTDKLDAKLLALFGEKMAPRPTERPSPKQLELEAFVLRRRQLVEMRAMELTRQKQVSSKKMKQSITKMINVLSKQIDAVEADIQKLVESDDDWKNKADILDSAPGIASGNATTLVAELPELGELNRQEIATLVGLAPFNDDSGDRRGSRTIRGGRAAVRACLYMAAVSAVRATSPASPIQELFKRLRKRGKAFKVAIVACMRKLLTTLNSMIKTNTKWGEHRAVLLPLE
jgi:transposase